MHRLSGTKLYDPKNDKFLEVKNRGKPEKTKAIRRIFGRSEEHVDQKKEVVFVFFSGRYVGNGDIVSLKGKLFFNPTTGCIYLVHEL